MTTPEMVMMFVFFMLGLLVPQTKSNGGYFPVIPLVRWLWLMFGGQLVAIGMFLILHSLGLPVLKYFYAVPWYFGIPLFFLAVEIFMWSVRAEPEAPHEP